MADPHRGHPAGLHSAGAAGRFAGVRRLRPWLGQVLAVLLMMQWGGGLAACLAAARWDPSQVLCHAAEPDPDQTQDGAFAAGCPLCAPLPPSLLPVLPDVPVSRATATGTAIAETPVIDAGRIPQLTPQQPRAPPFLS